MLIFISDLHLRPGFQAHLPRVQQFERFWKRLEAQPHERAPRLVIVGDFIDLVRTEFWFEGSTRPYDEPSPELALAVDELVRRTILEEQAFFAALREKTEAGLLEIELLLGNHDRLLADSAPARRRLRAALGMPGGDAPFPTELSFPEQGVLAYHGHTNDRFCHEAEGASISDFLCPELIVPFPALVRETLGVENERLDDIDDVRPIFAVPSWVRSLASKEQRGVGSEVVKIWGGLVEGFLGLDAVNDWFKTHHSALRFDMAQKIKLLLQLSTKNFRLRDKRFQEVYRFLFNAVDNRFAEQAWAKLNDPEHKHARYVVNGHTHFATMKPLGVVPAGTGVYFNTGTWRTVHQLGSMGDEGFLAYDAMAYLVFFDRADPMGRHFEWWHGVATRA